jgi:hypothetical protein
VFEGINASVFRQPEAFLQFLVFTERREEEVDSTDKDRVADVPHADGSSGTQSRFAFTGKRHTSSDTPSDTTEDFRIDIIPEGDVSSEKTPEDKSSGKKSSEINYAERKTERKS